MVDSVLYSFDEMSSSNWSSFGLDYICEDSFCSGSELEISVAKSQYTFYVTNDVANHILGNIYSFS